MPPLVGLPQVGLDAEQLLDVAGFIEPKLHPDTAEMIIMMSGSLEDNIHLMKGSLPLMLSWCQGLGLLSSSETEPWDRPSTNSPKS